MYARNSIPFQIFESNSVYSPPRRKTMGFRLYAKHDYLHGGSFINRVTPDTAFPPVYPPPSDQNVTLFFKDFQCILDSRHTCTFQFRHPTPCDRILHNLQTSPQKRVVFESDLLSEIWLKIRKKVHKEVSVAQIIDIKASQRILNALFVLMR